MGINLGEIFPDFKADTTIGEISFHSFLGDSWGVLFSHPADFTPVCTTELGVVNKLVPEFAKRNVKPIALSCDPVESHKSWIADITAYSQDGDWAFPIIADPKRELAVKFGMLDPDEKDKAGMPLTARCVFIISPDKKMKLSLLYPASCGRNFDEIIRVIDSLQLSVYKRVATPVNWKNGDDCIVCPTITAEEVKTMFPKHYIKDLPSGKPYMRFTPQP